MRFLAITDEPGLEDRIRRWLPADVRIVVARSAAVAVEMLSSDLHFYAGIIVDAGMLVKQGGQSAPLLQVIRAAGAVTAMLICGDPDEVRTVERSGLDAIGFATCGLDASSQVREGWFLRARLRFLAGSVPREYFAKARSSFVGP